MKTIIHIIGMQGTGKTMVSNKIIKSKEVFITDLVNRKPYTRDKFQVNEDLLFKELNNCENLIVSSQFYSKKHSKKIKNIAKKNNIKYINMCII